ncbi:hypothetical protein C9374_008512 [Naegleria lovaniensis]|uniref:Uncharacterized protein n=1 Tax=Naegleria lovaniensis TaxID=51637 RepID=A0AA88GFF1_NAELO|nr:uncharacterized protein C9374_008512 [Naegleria lovaniensis]KAG2378369.1 hypothetical protein C9374_008512 [Naegleria lovaniensis]
MALLEWVWKSPLLQHVNSVVGMVMKDYNVIHLKYEDDVAVADWHGHYGFRVGFPFMSSGYQFLAQQQNSSNNDPGNTNSTLSVSTVMDHFPPWLSLFTLIIIVIFFAICCLQTCVLNRRKKSSTRRLQSFKWKYWTRYICCCCYDSQSQVIPWNIPLQFSFQFLIAFFIGTLHRFFLQYFFESTYEYTCFHFLDTIVNKMRRTCPLINVVDVSTAVVVKSTYLLLLVFWLELTFNASYYYNPQMCKRFERVTRRIYWAFIGVYFFGASIGFLAFTIARSNISYFLTSITLIFDISIPILFIIFGGVLRRLTTRSKVSFPVLIQKHLKRVSIISIILGCYLLLLPAVRISVLVLKNVVYASNGYNAVSSIVEVTVSILFFFLPSVVIFGIVIAPTSISFLHNAINDRNARARAYKTKWKELETKNINSPSKFYQQDPTLFDHRESLDHGHYLQSGALSVYQEISLEQDIPSNNQQQKRY